MQDTGYYGPNSINWKLRKEAIVMLGSAPAALMALAHPLIAEAMYAHSSYMVDPLERMERTFQLGRRIVFGSSATARDAARTINRMHADVHGTLKVEAGAYTKGTSYKAHDQGLLLWVHATVIDTILRTYCLCIGPLNITEQEQFYQESKEVVHLLGLLPTSMPKNLADLRHYIDEMIHSNHLAATPQSRQLAHQVLFPPVPLILRPFLHLNLLITCGLLPQPIREIYGMDWSKKQQFIFNLLTLSFRAIIPHLPLCLRVLPSTRRLMRT